MLLHKFREIENIKKEKLDRENKEKEEKLYDEWYSMEKPEKLLETIFSGEDKIYGDDFVKYNLPRDILSRFRDNNTLKFFNRFLEEEGFKYSHFRDEYKIIMNLKKERFFFPKHNNRSFSITNLDKKDINGLKYNIKE